MNIDINQNFISFDLETLGNSSNAPIIQIGAAVFSVKDGIIDTFQRNVKWESLSKYGFSMDYSTVKWWMNQEEVARKSVLQENGTKDIKTVLKDFSHWVLRDTHAWSHATFDPPILKNAYSTVGIDCPIHYRNFLDIRTLNLIAGKVEIEREGVAHSALDDAIHQAKYISLMLKKLVK